MQVDAAKYARLEHIFALRLYARQQEAESRIEGDQMAALDPEGGSAMGVLSRATVQDYALSGEDLVNHYLSLTEASYGSLEEIGAERELAAKVLWRLVTKEQKFLTVSGEAPKKLKVRARAARGSGGRPLLIPRPPALPLSPPPPPHACPPPLRPPLAGRRHPAGRHAAAPVRGLRHPWHRGGHRRLGLLALVQRGAGAAALVARSSSTRRVACA